MRDWQSFFESENDPFRILFELDRGLRSGQVGDQTEAISLFPSFLKQHPFPLIFNNSFLKLSELFRITGSNLIRYCILGVVEQCESQLYFLINVEEIIRRFSAVLQSNDPLARALTLRALGAMHLILTERLEIHHIILGCLESPFIEEVEGGIAAMDKICCTSPSLCRKLLPSIVKLLSGVETNLEMKLKLIRLLRRMKHEPDMVFQTRKFCTELISNYFSRRFVVTILDTLTCLAEDSLLEIPAQIELLMFHLFRDKRVRVQLLCLQNLSRLSKKAPNLNFYIHVSNISP